MFFAYLGDMKPIPAYYCGDVHWNRPCYYDTPRDRHNYRFLFPEKALKEYRGT